MEYNPPADLQEVDEPDHRVMILTLQRLYFDDLPREWKNRLKFDMEISVWNYWNEWHLIPTGSDLKRMRQDILDSFVYMDHIYIKDDDEVSRFMNDRIGPTINKELRKENRKRNRE